MPSAWPAWLVMWTLAGGVYGACKLLTWCAAGDADHGATWWRHAGYLLAWPGMDAPAFLAKTSVQPSRLSRVGRGRSARRRSARVWSSPSSRPRARPRRSSPAGSGSWGWCSSCTSGHSISCRAPGDALASTRVRSWRHHFGRSASPSSGAGDGTPHSAICTHRFVFTPLRRRLGPPAAILAGFVGSGRRSRSRGLAAGPRRVRWPDGLLRSPGCRPARRTQRRRAPAGPRPRHPRARSSPRRCSCSPLPLPVPSRVRRARRRPVPPCPRCRMTNQTMALLLTRGRLRPGQHPDRVVARACHPALARGTAAAAPPAPADALGLRRLRRARHRRLRAHQRR